MITSTRAGLFVATAAIVLGLLADALLREGTPGLGAAVWTALLCLGAATLSARIRPLAPGGMIALGGAALYATVYAWRDSAALHLLAAVAAVLCLCIAARPRRTHRSRGTSSFPETLSVGAGSALFGAIPLLARDVRWNELPHRKLRASTAAVCRGLLVALPLALLFGALFASADAVFRQLVARALDIDPSLVAAHLRAIAIAAWMAAGYLRGALLRVHTDAEAIYSTQSGPVRCFPVEAMTALVTLDALFGVFVFVQMRYLFGGQALVVRTIGMTYAAYARSGFFELTAVIGLVLPACLALEWLFGRGRLAPSPLFRGLEAMLIAMVCIVAASALRRLALYEHAFGLTELRYYVTAAVWWLAAVVAWFGTTRLAARPAMFSTGVAAAALAAVALLCLANPDSAVARANIQRAKRDGAFDVAYSTSLSADAVPELVRGLPRLPPLDRARLEQALQSQWSHPSGDWRAWNADRAVAQSTVAGLCAQAPQTAWNKS